MPSYHYIPSSTIRDVTFKRTEGAQNYAYLQAGEHPDPSALDAAMRSAAERGWQVVPTHLGATPVLQISNYRQHEDIIHWLQSDQLVQGTPTITEDKTEKTSFKDRIKKRSLAASGIAYLVGDTSFMKYGYAGNDPLNVAAGVMYLSGTASLLGFGRKDQSDLQIRNIARKLNDYMRENGKSLEQTCSLDSIEAKHNRGLIKKADDFFRQYPSEMMNLFFAAAGNCIMTSAYRAHIKPADAQKALHEVQESAHELLKRWNGNPTKFAKQLQQSNGSFDTVVKRVQKINKVEGWMDIGLGGMTGISGMFAMLIKEKKPDPDAPKKEGWEKIWEKIQEKPLAIAGYGYMVSTMCHAVSTTLAWNYASNERRKSVPWRETFVASNLIAELLLAISSKGHGEGVKSDGKVDSTIISLAAEQIAKQPIAMQEGLVEHVVAFLGRPDVLALKNDETRQQLTHEIELMRNNPWAHAKSAGLQNPTRTAMPTAPDAALDASWQRKITTPPTMPETQIGA